MCITDNKLTIRHSANQEWDANGRAHLEKQGNAMNAQNTNANITLSDNDLKAVSGGTRHQVTKQQYELLLAIRMAVAHGK